MHPTFTLRALAAFAALAAAATGYARADVPPDSQPTAAPALVMGLVAKTPHLRRTQDDYCGSMIGCKGWYEFDNAKDVAGLVSTATTSTGILANGQKIVVVPLDSGGNDKGAQYALLYTTVDGSTKFVGYIPAPWGELQVYVDKAGRLESSWEDSDAWPAHPQASEAEKSNYQVITTYDLSGITLTTLTTQHVHYIARGKYEVVK